MPTVLLQYPQQEPPSAFIAGMIFIEWKLVSHDMFRVSA